MGRRKRKLTDKEVLEIEQLFGFGLTSKQVAGYFKISDETLRQRVQDQKGVAEAIQLGRAKAAAAVTQTLFKMATSGKVPAATFFWLKTQLGWREKVDVDLNLVPKRVFKTTVEADGSLIQQIIDEERAAKGQPPLVPGQEDETGGNLH